MVSQLELTFGRRHCRFVAAAVLALLLLGRDHVCRLAGGYIGISALHGATAAVFQIHFIFVVVCLVWPVLCFGGSLYMYIYMYISLLNLSWAV